MEEVGHKNLDLTVRLGVRQNVGTLLDWRAQAENVINNENGRFRRGVSGMVYTVYQS